MNTDIYQYAEVLFECGHRYVALERRVRQAIDRVVSPVCSSCIRVCCKAAYCRETPKNPWYYFLFTQFSGGKDIDWKKADPPPGLGRNGCEIRAGRYAYCYAYNCRAVLMSLKTDQERNYFRKLSEILKDIGLNFADKRHLTDIRNWDDITLARLLSLNERIKEGETRFAELSHLLFHDFPE